MKVVKGVLVMMLVAALIAQANAHEVEEVIRQEAADCLASYQVVGKYIGPGSDADTCSGNQHAARVADRLVNALRRATAETKQWRPAFVLERCLDDMFSHLPDRDFLSRRDRALARDEIQLFSVPIALRDPLEKLPGFSSRDADLLVSGIEHCVVSDGPNQHYGTLFGLLAVLAGHAKLSELNPDAGPGGSPEWICPRHGLGGCIRF